MRHLVTLACLLLLSAGFAHSELKTSTPQDGATLSTLPEVFTLTFSEAIETDFSSFVIYPLGTEVVVEAASRQQTHQEHESPDHSAAHGDLDQAAEARLPHAFEDTNAFPLATLRTQGSSATVDIAVPQDLKPGAYMIAYRALSEDTHTIQGFVTFRLEP